MIVKARREFTEEELLQDVTWDRLQSAMCHMGEDFCYQNENLVDYRVFQGWIMHKYPEKCHYLLEALVEWNREIMTLKEFYDEILDDHTSDQDDELFYRDYAEFVNLTTITKGRVNSALFSITEGIYEHGNYLEDEDE